MKNANDQDFFNLVGGFNKRGLRQRVIRYKVYNDSNAYFLMIQSYKSIYTDKYGSTIIEKTNLNLSHNS